MRLHKPLNGTNLDHLFAASSAFESRKSRVLNVLNHQPRHFKLSLTHREAGQFIHRHMDAVERYVLEAGKGWGTLDRDELVSRATWWKRMGGNKARIGLKLKNEVSEAWHQLAELEQQSLTGGGLEGRELATWCGLSKQLWVMGFLFVQGRMAWQTNDKPVLQIVPPLVFRSTFPEADVGDARPELYLCRVGAFEVVGVVPEVSSTIDCKAEPHVLD